MSEQRTQRLRNQLIAYDDAGRSLSFEDLVRILIILSGCKCHDLSRYICGKLLLARCALNFNVIAPLALPEAYELHRNDLCALMKELIEGMLSVRARLTVDDRTCLIIQLFSETVHMLTVGLHVKLLKMCRESAEGL